MASNFGGLAYCCELPVDCKGAKVAKDCYFLSAWSWMYSQDIDLGSTITSHPKSSKP